jgi:hypothetical protein
MYSRRHATRLLLQVELLETRLVPSSPGSLTRALDPALDQFGRHIETVQAYGTSRFAVGTFDTGAMPISFSAGAEDTFRQMYRPIPIKVYGGAQAEGVGGLVSGDVSMPGLIMADGIHALPPGFDGSTLSHAPVHLSSQSAQVTGVQAFIGTEDGSPDLPTITGMPILSKSGMNPSGLAAEIALQGYQVSQGYGKVTTEPDLWFVSPSTQLAAGPHDLGPYQIPMTLSGTDNHLNPGSSVTLAPTLVQTNVKLVLQGASVSGQKFLFDTGAGISVISTAEAKALGVNLSNPAGTIDVQGVGGVATVPEYNLDALVLPLSGTDTLTFTNVPVYVLDVAPGIDGILGMNLWNTADGLLVNPNGAGGPSVSVTFFGNPQRSSSDATLEPSSGFKAKAIFGALVVEPGMGKVFTPTGLLGQIGRGLTLSAQVQAGTLQPNLLALFVGSGPVCAPTFAPTSIAQLQDSRTAPASLTFFATTLQKTESRQESGGGQNQLIVGTNSQDAQQPAGQGHAAPSTDDLMKALDVVRQSAASAQADAASWQQACEVCFAQEQGICALVELDAPELSATPAASPALHLAALALLLGGTWASTSGNRRARHSPSPRTAVRGLTTEN